MFTTKYRKPVLRGDVALIREICRSNDIEIVRGHVSGEHVHLLLSVKAEPGDAGHQGQDVAPSAGGFSVCKRSSGVDTCGREGTSWLAAGT